MSYTLGNKYPKRRETKMKVTVVGKERLQGVSKKTGKEYNATLVHITYKKQFCDGLAAETVYVDQSFAPYESFNLSKTYDLERDGRGYMISFSEVR